MLRFGCRLKPTVVASLLLSLALLAGCSEVPPAAESEGSLRVTVLPTATSLSQGDPLSMRVSIQNNGDQEELWGSGSSRCRLSLTVLVEGEYLSAGPPRPCTMDMVQYRLAPQEHYEATLQWDGTVLRDGRSEMLPAGDYALYGIGGEARSEAIHLSLKAAE